MARIPSIYPLVSKVIEPHMIGAGKFVGTQPMGVTVHYSADRDLDRVCEQMQATKIGYHLIIQRDGKVVQTGYLDSRVNHAGKAEWKNKSPNRFHAAVALLSWGLVEPCKEELPPLHEAQFLSWADTKLPASEVAKRRGNLSDETYYWDAATPEQLKSLEEILLWFINLGISVKDICGHDESAVPKGRKIDPGGVLPWTMDEYRTYLEGKKNK